MPSNRQTTSRVLKFVMAIEPKQIEEQANDED